MCFVAAAAPALAGGLSASSVASMAFSVVGAVSQFVAQRQQAKAVEAKGKYDAAVARNNKILAQRQADDEREIGRIEEARHRQRIAQAAGTARAVLSASGFDATQDDAPVLQADIVEQGDIEARTIRANAERRARAFEFEGANQGAQAEAILAGTRRTGFEGFGTLISGAASVADKWHSYKQGAVVTEPTPDPVWLFE